MPLHFTAADYVVVGIVLCISAFVVLYFRLTSHHQRNTQECLMSCRNMSILPVAFSLTASTFSAISALGIPAEVYLYGVQILYGELAYNIGGLIAVYTFLPVLFDMDVSTSYEYLERRFGKVTRYVASLLFCVQMILYMPIVIYAPSLVFNAVTGLPVWTSVISIVLFCTFYSSLSSLKAVLWTDFFQTILMFLTLLLVIIKGALDVGGFSNIYDTAKEGGRFDIQISSALTELYTIWNCVLQAMVFGLYSNGTCHVQVQRLMSVENLKKAQRSYLLSIPVTFLFKSLCCFSGIVVYSYFHDCDPLQIKDGKISSSDQIMPSIILKLFDHLHGMPGLCIAGIFSASLSTMSSSVNALVATSLKDFIKPVLRHRKLKDSTLSFLAKILGLVYGAVCVLLVFVIASHKGILEGAIITNGMVGGPTLGIYFLGMFTQSANEIGTLIGLFAGFIINAWMAFGSLHSKAKYASLQLATGGCASSNSSSYSSNFDTNSAPNLSYETEIRNVTEGFSLLDEKERYIFPLYKVSYMWFTTISCLSVILVGYISSLIIGKWKHQNVDPQNFSPVFKKWLNKGHEPAKEYVKLSLRMNQIEFFRRSHAFQKDDFK